MTKAQINKVGLRIASLVRGCLNGVEGTANEVQGFGSDHKIYGFNVIVDGLNFSVMITPLDRANEPDHTH